MAEAQRMPTHYRFQDLTGLEVNEWTVLEYVGRRPKAGALWLCECSCGTRKVWHTAHIKGQMSQSCGCKRPTLAERLWANIVKRDVGCWEWQGACAPFGYGKLWDPGPPRRCVGTHRLVYELCVGSVPEGMFVLHKCDNPPCCRPDHLYVGTPKDNMDDRSKRGRQPQKLQPSQVMEIYRRWNAGESSRKLGPEFGVSGHLARLIGKGLVWKHVLQAVRVEPRTYRCRKQ